MTAWTNIEAPLVCIFPNSTTRFRPGNWNIRPGVNNTNSTTATNTGPQSVISSDKLLLLCNSSLCLLISAFEDVCRWYTYKLYTLHHTTVWGFCPWYCHLGGRVTWGWYGDRDPLISTAEILLIFEILFRHMAFHIQLYMSFIAIFPKTFNHRRNLPKLNLPEINESYQNIKSCDTKFEY